MFKTSGKSAEGPVDTVGEELGKLSGFTYFNQKNNQEGDEQQIRHFPFDRRTKWQDTRHW